MQLKPTAALKPYSPTVHALKCQQKLHLIHAPLWRERALCSERRVENIYSEKPPTDESRSKVDTPGTPFAPIFVPLACECRMHVLVCNL